MLDCAREEESKEEAAGHVPAVEARCGPGHTEGTEEEVEQLIVPASCANHHKGSLYGPLASSWQVFRASLLERRQDLYVLHGLWWACAWRQGFWRSIS